MADQSHLHPADIHGLSRLAVEATLGVAGIAEALHYSIAGTAAGGITGLVYGSIRGITRLVGGALDTTLAPLAALLGERASTPAREAMLAALNGVVGDHLAASGNPLAIGMQLRYAGQALELAPAAIAAAVPNPGRRVLLLAHGLCLNDAHWLRNGHDHGARLAGDLGYTPVYLRYNTGLHIAENGRALAALIEQLADAWPAPIDELAIVAHSMGGLVVRSACHYGAQAGLRWPGRLRAIAFLGTPHHGAPLERVGSWVHALLALNPYTAAFARLGQIRSAGITDLRYGSVLDDDWAGRNRFALSGDHHHPAPLPTGPRCYAIAATLGRAPGDARDALLGDGLVPLASALGQHASQRLAFPEAHQWVGYGIGHMGLLDQPEVYDRLREWLAG
ncbi:esterase/lipase family protein [Kouleothrix sp.]|uniref:esterase/lipase family protein n=1 Tax=Kouleothrix sp. TaxID=2779161 RepID=UPI00391ADADD